MTPKNRLTWISNISLLLCGAHHLPLASKDAMPAKKPHVAAWLLLALLAGVIFQVIASWPYQIRFESTWVNHWVFAVAAISFPFLAGWLALSLPGAWVRVLAQIFIILLFIPCLLIASCAALEAPRIGEVDKGYELISEAADGAVTYRLYRTNCGATCSYGLSLREERTLFLGAKLVSHTWGLDRVSEGRVVLKDSRVLVLDGEKVLVDLSR